MKLNSNFPTYHEFDPLVPVWCITPDRPACIHRFFDSSPISPSGRYLAVFQMPFEDREPEPGEKGQVVLVDLETGKDRVAAETCGWEPQLGANINWGGSDHELFFNDVDTQSWIPFAWKLDPVKGTKERMQGTVYHASPDGRHLISANMTSMRVTQPGYGVWVPENYVRWNRQLADDDGFYLTDTQSGQCRLLLSIKDAVEKTTLVDQIEDPAKVEVYGFHSKFNPQGDRLMLSLRWFQTTGEPQRRTHYRERGYVHFAWITVGIDGRDPKCAVGPEEWAKGGHHATWFPDGKHISMNLRIDRDVLRLVQVEANGNGLRKMHNQVIGSGHPTLHPDGRHVMTDTYLNESVAYGDGTVPLRWIDLQTGEEQNVVRINAKQPCPDGTLRVDPHPAWDRTNRYVTFNGFVGGTRRVFVADMRESIL